MSIRFHNTLTRSLEEFVPMEPGKVRLYTCGPTVYNFAHVGNFRAYLFEDLLHRHLEFRGLECTQIMNLTDVDDKTIKGAIAQGVPLKDFTKPYIDAFFADLKTLNITPADRYPAATDHVPEMIKIIETLIAKGHAYQSDDKSVYYRIDSFPHYGCLAHLDREGMRSGVRIQTDEYEKDNVADFALWKAWDEKDGDIAWDSPWGRGRPGWHIECSAMAMKYLGESFDMHTGGVDNVFPHHDDEIAQSEAATGKKFVNYWLHCAHLVVEGKKMSKSAGNFFTLRDILNKGWSGREIRYVLLATHYRMSLNFTFEGLAAARTALQRLDEFRTRLVETVGQTAGLPAQTGPSAPLPSWAAKGLADFTAALDDDLNISGGLAALFDLVRDGNRALDSKELNTATAAAVLKLWNDLDRVLGFLQPPAEEIPAEILALVEQRQQARKNKDWAASDKARDELAAKGWEVKDTPQGPKLRIIKKSLVELKNAQGQRHPSSDSLIANPFVAFLEQLLRLNADVFGRMCQTTIYVDDANGRAKIMLSADSVRATAPTTLADFVSISESVFPAKYLTENPLSSEAETFAQNVIDKVAHEHRAQKKK